MVFDILNKEKRSITNTTKQNTLVQMDWGILYKYITL